VGCGLPFRRSTWVRLPRFSDTAQEVARHGGTQNHTRGEFHVAIREMEPGVFRAEYRGELNPDNPDERELPAFYVGSNVAGVKIWVEQMARSMGYHRVDWDALPQ
jgi:hypothetical protein